MTDIKTQNAERIVQEIRSNHNLSLLSETGSLGGRRISKLSDLSKTGPNKFLRACFRLMHLFYLIRLNFCRNKKSTYFAKIKAQRTIYNEACLKVIDVLNRRRNESFKPSFEAHLEHINDAVTIELSIKSLKLLQKGKVISPFLNRQIDYTLRRLDGLNAWGSLAHVNLLQEFAKTRSSNPDVVSIEVQSDEIRKMLIDASAQTNFVQTNVPTQTDKVVGVKIPEAKASPIVLLNTPTPEAPNRSDSTSLLEATSNLIATSLPIATDEQVKNEVHATQKSTENSINMIKTGFLVSEVPILANQALFQHAEPEITSKSSLPNSNRERIDETNLVADQTTNKETNARNLSDLITYTIPCADFTQEGLGLSLQQKTRKEDLIKNVNSIDDLYAKYAKALDNIKQLTIKRESEYQAEKVKQVSVPAAIPKLPPIGMPNTPVDPSVALLNSILNIENKVKQIDRLFEGDESKPAINLVYSIIDETRAKNDCQETIREILFGKSPVNIDTIENLSDYIQKYKSIANAEIEDLNRKIQEFSAHLEEKKAKLNHVQNSSPSNGLNTINEENKSIANRIFEIESLKMQYKSATGSIPSANRLLGLKLTRIDRKIKEMEDASKEFLKSSEFLNEAKMDMFFKLKNELMEYRKDLDRDTQQKAQVAYDKPSELLQKLKAVLEIVDIVADANEVLKIADDEIKKLKTKIDSF